MEKKKKVNARLNTFQHFMQNVGSSFHDPYISIRRVGRLSIFDRIGETVGKLFFGSKKIGFDKLNHAMVL